MKILILVLKWVLHVNILVYENISVSIKVTITFQYISIWKY